MPSLNEKELPTVYQNATALALPSYYEGFGLPLIEAMAAGCPVVASQAGPFPELAEGAAILFDPFDPKQIGLALEEISNPSKRIELIEKGKIQAAKFSWDLSAKKHFESYQMALKDKA
jgi:glycosyltransferase involved in cell wall biosynthesis